MQFIMFITLVSISRLNLYKILRSFDVLVDPWQQRGDSCVDSRILSLAAANAPRDNAHLGVATAFIDDHRATRVALLKIGKISLINHRGIKKTLTNAARILGSLASTDHGLNDATGRSTSIFLCTLCIRPDWYVHLL